MFFCQPLCTRHTPSFCFQFDPLGGLFLAAGPVLGSLVACDMSSRLSGTSPILTEMRLVIACAGGFFVDVRILKYKRCKQQR